MTIGTTYDNINSDLIIVDRLWSPDIDIHKAEKLRYFTRKKGIPLVYSLDDNLIDLNINEPGKTRPSIHEKNIIRYFAREADGIIVSTPALKERIKNLNDTLFVVENALDERLIDLDRRYADGSDRLVIGYMGTYTHDRDFCEIYPALRNVLYKYKDRLRLEVVGSVSDNRLLGSIPNAKQLDTRGNVEYTRFWDWMNGNIHWDIAIAPLVRNEFTKCKSDIKYLDYAALGTPAICTKFVPYENSVIHGKSGLLVENDAESWIDAIVALIDDEELREELRENAREYLISNRILDKCVFKWENALSEIYDSQNSS